MLPNRNLYITLSFHAPFHVGHHKDIFEFIITFSWQWISVPMPTLIWLNQWKAAALNKYSSNTTAVVKNVHRLLAHTCFFSTVHLFSKGFKSGLCEGHSELQFQPESAIHLPALMCVWDHCPVGHPTAPKSQSSADDFRFSWRIWRKYLLISPHTFFRADPLAARRPGSIIPPAPCWTTGTLAGSFVTCPQRQTTSNWFADHGVTEPHRESMGCYQEVDETIDPQHRRAEGCYQSNLGCHNTTHSAIDWPPDRSHVRIK